MKLILILIFLSITYVWSNNTTDNVSVNTAPSIVNNYEDLIFLGLSIGFIIIILLLVFLYRKCGSYLNNIIKQIYNRRKKYNRGQINSQEVIELTSGIFDTYQIKWLYDLDHDGVWDDDIWIIDNLSSQGLVSRSIYVLGATAMDENGNPIDGYSNWIEHHTLTFTNVGENY